MLVATGYSKQSGSDVRQRFIELFRQHQPAIRGYIYSLLPNSAEAEEIMQQTSIVLWRKFPMVELEQESDFIRWAVGVAHYEVRNHRKKLSRDRHVFSCELLSQLADRGEARMNQLEAERKALTNCLGQLDRRQRDLVRRCYSGDTTMKQVADSIGDTANSIYKRLNRIRASLLRCIQRNLSMER